MNWNDLWDNLLNGKPDTIQAVFSIFGVIITLLGTIYVAITFHQQRKINAVQQNINLLAIEKDRRELFPWFTGVVDRESDTTVFYNLILKDNKALDVEIIPIDQTGNFLKPKYEVSQVVIPRDNAFDIVEVKKVNIQPDSTFIKQYLLYYLDQVGRPYTQELGHDGKKVVLLYPQTVPMDFRRKMKLIK